MVEFPLYPHRVYFANAPYMLSSTRHWKPLVNGYSAFIPPTFYRICDALESFPAADAMRALRDLGVSHVVVHNDAVHVPDNVDGLSLVDRRDNISLYRVSSIHP